MAALIGASGVSRARRWQIAALLTVFEGGMPLIGLALGAPLARAIGSAADYVAAAALIALGAWTLFSDEDKEEEAAKRFIKCLRRAKTVKARSRRSEALSARFRRSARRPRG